MNLPRGFSLIEMVITIVVLGIVAVAAAAFPFRALHLPREVGRRAALVEAAEGAIRRLSRDIRASIPHSERVTHVLAVGTGFAR